MPEHVQYDRIVYGVDSFHMEGEMFSEKGQEIVNGLPGDLI